MPKLTKEIQHFNPAQCRPFAMDSRTKEATLAKFGISFPAGKIRELLNVVGGAAMDVAPNLITTPSIPTLVQFLQHWIPEIIEVVTAPTDADSIIGKTIAGTWADEEIVQTILERTGQPRPYGDTANAALASWNAGFEKRTIVRFEEGLEVGILEEERSARMRINSAQQKREAVASSLEIERNLIAYFGYSDGTNKTYGLLNDPNLDPYTTVAPNAAGTSTRWEDKIYEEQQADVLHMIAELQTKTKNLWNAKRDRAILTVALASDPYMSKANMYGESLNKWLKENYPNITVNTTFFFDGANATANVAYLHAETLNGRRVIAQYVQEVLRFLGVNNKGKSYEEFYSNATAGTMVRMPLGVVRRSGI